MNTPSEISRPVSVSTDATAAPTPESKKSLLNRWGKRAGIFAFMFFFIKGLAWLVVPVALATWWAK